MWRHLNYYGVRFEKLRYCIFVVANFVWVDVVKKFVIELQTKWWDIKKNIIKRNFEELLKGRLMIFFLISHHLV